MWRMKSSKKFFFFLVVLNMSSRWRYQLSTEQNVTRNVVSTRGKFLSSVLIFAKCCVLSLGHAMCTFRFWLADVKEIDGYLQTESQSSLVLCPRSQANSYAKLSRRGLIQDLVKSAATLPRILSLPRMQVEFILLVIELCAAKMQLPWRWEAESDRFIYRWVVLLAENLDLIVFYVEMIARFCVFF